ncbi:MAG: hypothetical protein R3C49_00465 [Planctomycetaceae bacterium]
MLLSKATWIIVFGIWPAMWLGWRLLATTSRNHRWWLNEPVQMVSGVCLALYVLNLGYGFEGSGTRLRDYQFISTAIGGPLPAGDEGKGQIPYPRDFFLGSVRNQFTNRAIGAIPVPLPRNFVQGIDRQKFHFEKENWSYLRGQWRNRGWIYYYVYAAAVKVPLGIWLLAGCSLLLAVCQPVHRCGLSDEIFVLTAAFSLLLFVSLQTGFNRHLRYVLPCFPFVFILISRVATTIPRKQWLAAVPAILACVWLVASSLATFPHHLSYFNELVGGPTNGWKHLSSSNTDWGQDLLHLKTWLEEHPEAGHSSVDDGDLNSEHQKPLGLAWHVRVVEPELAGIQSRPVPEIPEPGWFAVSVNRLHDRSGDYAYFQQLKPIAWAGYSIPIYHLTTADCNRLRQPMGFPPVEFDDLLTESNCQVTSDQGALRCLATSGGDDRIFMGGDAGSVDLFHVPTGELRMIAKAGSQVRSIAVSATHHRLLAGCANGNLVVIDNLTNDSPNLQTLGTGLDAVNQMALNLHETLVAIGGDSGTIEIRSVGKPDQVQQTIRVSLPVLALSLSPDGKTLAVGTGDWRTGRNGETTLWDTATGQLTSRAPDSAAQAKSLAFSPDGRLLVLRDHDGTLKICDTESFTSVCRLDHSRNLLPVCWSADGQFLAAGDHDGALKIWNASDGRLLVRTSVHEGIVYDLKWSNDLTTIATVGRDGRLKVLNLSPVRLRSTRSQSSVTAEQSGDSPPLPTRVSLR